MCHVRSWTEWRLQTSEANEIAKGQKKPFNLKKEHPDKIQWKIDGKTTPCELLACLTLRRAVPANRYDLLCPDGLARAFKIFRGSEEAPTFRAVPAAEPLQLKGEPSGRRVILTNFPTPSQ